MNSIQKENIIEIITSQTNYDKKTAEQKLKEWDDDFIKVIKEFLNPNFQKKEKEDYEKKNKIVSINQSIMNELRKFKDKQNATYNYNKKFIDYIKKSHEVDEINNFLSKKDIIKQKSSTDISNNNPENIYL
jgi:2,4-dienoyl-CoA reductase-like NADH-dependent reductase (Old Yellow Enzyme family)